MPNILAFGPQFPDEEDLCHQPNEHISIERLLLLTKDVYKRQEYIEAAKSCGTSNARIIFRHILPNAIGPIVVNAMLTVSRAILQVASLSFIGLGISCLLYTSRCV